MSDHPGIIDEFLPQLDWIDQQQTRMVQLVSAWAGINSHSENIRGLGLMATALRSAFEPLADTCEQLALPAYTRIDHLGREAPVPTGPALRMFKRPAIRPRVLLAIHMDTVYPADGPFQKVDWVDSETLRGPGVTDAKGGLAVMLLALEAFERSSWAQHLGWQVLINPDEELGSPSSACLFKDAASQSDLGLLFEPALDAQTLVGERRGSGNFTIVVSGRSAHAGRDFDRGRNAIVALAGIVTAIDALNCNHQGMTWNVGRIDGGGPVNVVPDSAVARVNVRISQPSQSEQVTRQLAQIVDHANQQEGIRAQCFGAIQAPPKPLDPSFSRLLQQAATCSTALGRPLTWRPSGGVCDGNRLAAWGLPNIDSLSAVGGAIHSPQEHLFVDSLVYRAKLTALLLLTLARGDWSVAK